MTTRGNEEQLLTTSQVADLLQVPISTVYRWRLHGDGPPAIKIGKHLRFDAEQLRVWIASRTDDGRT